MTTTTVLALKSGVLTPVLLDSEDARRIRSKLSIGSHGYAQMWDGGTVVLVHRFITGCVKGDGKHVDHLNGEPLDNRQVNLKVGTRRENMANLKSRPGRRRGVHLHHTGRWMAKGWLNNKSVYLGLFDTIDEAAEVAKSWRLENLPGYQER